MDTLRKNKTVISTPDFEFYSFDNYLVQAESENNFLRLKWHNGTSSTFHNIWLRDNCACSICIDAISKERLYNPGELSLDVKVKELQICEQGGLQVIWDDDHTSHFHPGWLWHYDYTNHGDLEPKPQRIPWDQSSEDLLLNTFDAEQIIHDEKIQSQLIEQIIIYGIAQITNMNKNINYLEKLATKVGLIRDMNWGKIYEICVNPEGNYIADRSDPLVAHSDAATREYMPGIQIFQCVENNCIGGESFWVDGLNLFNLMRDNYPDQWKVLTEIPWKQADRSTKTHYRCSRPVFTLDREGDLMEVRDTAWLREPLLATPSLVEKLYEAYFILTKMKNDRQNQIQKKLIEGDVAIIDNRRLLHGRRAIDTTKGIRQIRTCYTEREEMFSTLRILKRNAIKAEHELNEK